MVRSDYDGNSIKSSGSNCLFSHGYTEAWEIYLHVLVVHFCAFIYLWWIKCLFLCDSFYTPVSWRHVQSGCPQIFMEFYPVIACISLQTTSLSEIGRSEKPRLFRSRIPSVHFADADYGQSLSAQLIHRKLEFLFSLCKKIAWAAFIWLHPIWLRIVFVHWAFAGKWAKLVQIIDHVMPLISGCRECLKCNICMRRHVLMNYINC